MENQKQNEFVISVLSREDLEELGYDTSNLSNDMMQKIANKLGDYYCDYAFLDDLISLANYFNIPKHGKSN